MKYILPNQITDFIKNNQLDISTYRELGVPLTQKVKTDLEYLYPLIPDQIDQIILSDFEKSQLILKSLNFYKDDISYSISKIGSIEKQTKHQGISNTIELDQYHIKFKDTIDYSLEQADISPSNRIIFSIENGKLEYETIALMRITADFFDYDFAYSFENKYDVLNTIQAETNLNPEVFLRNNELDIDKLAANWNQQNKNRFDNLGLSVKYSDLGEAIVFNNKGELACKVSDFLQDGGRYQQANGTIKYWKELNIETLSTQEIKEILDFYDYTTILQACGVHQHNIDKINDYPNVQQQAEMLKENISLKQVQKR